MAGRRPSFATRTTLSRDLLAASCGAAEVEIWAYVLMPNHVHLILTPTDVDGLRRALAPVHRRYAGHVHARLRRTGHFWQGRFGCVAMDEDHLAAALRYVALNPVRAHLVRRARDWPWSSARAHLTRRDDGVTTLAPVLERFLRFADLIEDEPEAGPELFERLRQADSIGRPLGDDRFISRLERLTRRSLAPAKRGPKASDQPRQLRAS
jgi:putative transposase